MRTLLAKHFKPWAIYFLSLFFVGFLFRVLFFLFHYPDANLEFNAAIKALSYGFRFDLWVLSYINIIFFLTYVSNTVRNSRITQTLFSSVHSLYALLFIVNIFYFGSYSSPLNRNFLNIFINTKLRVLISFGPEIFLTTICLLIFFVFFYWLYAKVFKFNCQFSISGFLPYFLIVGLLTVISSRSGLQHRPIGLHHI